MGTCTTRTQSTSFLPAIEALRSELANLEQQAAEIRALIEQLGRRCIDPAPVTKQPIKKAEAKQGTPAKSAEGSKGNAKTAPRAKPDDAYLVEASLAEAAGQVQSATHDKDPARFTR